MKNIGAPLARDRRYYRAEYWVRTRALMLPGVVFTAAIDCYNLSCWAVVSEETPDEVSRLRYRTWCSKDESKGGC